MSENQNPNALVAQPTPTVCADPQPPSAAAPGFSPVAGESDRAFEAFRAYLELGSRRRYAAVARKIGVSLRTVKRWAGDFAWPGRIKIHSASCANQSARTEAAVQCEEILDAAARARAFRERQFVLAEATRFIPARVDDNAFINPGYKADLARLTGWQHDAWYEGRWNFAAGQYFRNFSPRLHVLGADFKPPYGAEWFAAMDYGFTHPTVVLLGCRDDAGTIYVLDEHVERFWIPARHAQAIKSMFGRHEIFCSRDHLRDHLLARFPNACTEREALWHQWQKRRMLAKFVAGSDAFGRESSGDTVARQYREFGLSLKAANMDRVAGWSAIAQRLGDPDAGIPPALFIHPRCTRLIACLPYLQHNPDHPGDILKSNINEEGAGGDDPADALRYLVTIQINRIYVRKLTGF